MFAALASDALTAFVLFSGSSLLPDCCVCVGVLLPSSLGGDGHAAPVHDALRDSTRDAMVSRPWRHRRRNWKTLAP